MNNNPNSNSIGMALIKNHIYVDHTVTKNVKGFGPEMQRQQDKEVSVKKAFGLHQCNYDKSEGARSQSYQQEHGNEQRKCRKSQIKHQDSNAKKSRVAKLYELGKNKVKANRKLATTKPKGKTVIGDMRLAASSRITALYTLGKNRITANRKLATFLKPKDNTVTIISNVELAEDSRISVLYEMGKNRVLINRELAAIKLPEDDAVVANLDSAKPSKRIIALYELGKHRVTNNRESATARTLTTDTYAANIAILSGNEASPSEIAGQRLYIQAQLTSEKKVKMRRIARETPLPQMKLATQHPKCQKQCKILAKNTGKK